MEALPVVSTPHRRWLRFSLRSLLLLVLVLAVSFAWMIHKAKEQGIAVAALTKMGCQCEVAYDKAGNRPATVLEWFRWVVGEEEPRSVNWVRCSGSQITDTDLVHLNGLSRLKVLNLEGSHITDAGLVNLQGLTHLEELYLNESQLTDAGVERLHKALPKCKVFLRP